MLRTIVGFVLAAIVIAAAWLGLERGEAAGEEAIALIVLAFLPTLAVQLRRRWFVVAAVTALSTLLALSVAFEVSVANARPFEDRDFFGPVLDAFQEGVLAFFDTRVPFDPTQLTEMHGVTLFALFAFVTATGIAIAARQTLVAVAILAFGAGWPTTMLSIGPSSNRDLVVGSLILGTALALLALYRPGVRSFVPAAILGLALVVVAVGGATTNAVAKEGFVNWSRWDPYDRPDDPVDVSYVWDGNYGGIHFPEKRTTVLRIKASGRQSRLYWKATTLDRYNGAGWLEQLDEAQSFDAGQAVTAGANDPLVPDAARQPEALTKQDVEVEALLDSRLVGSTQAVRWRPSGDSDALLATNGTVVLDRELRRGERYTVWSYIPKDATPKALSEAGTDYPGAIYPYLLAQPELDPTALPRFGEPGRDDYMEQLFDDSIVAGEVRVPVRVSDHRVVYDTAKVVTAGQDTPYEATVALLSWFRGEEGGFTYTEQPPVELSKAPLLSFLETKQGYCQHFAGTMALMLRYLGIPARVAAGFTSGSLQVRLRVVGGHGPRRARLGRGLLPRLRLAHVRSDAGPRADRRRLRPVLGPVRRPRGGAARLGLPGHPAGRRACGAPRGARVRSWRSDRRRHRGRVAPRHEHRRLDPRNRAGNGACDRPAQARRATRSAHAPRPAGDRRRVQARPGGLPRRPGEGRARERDAAGARRRRRARLQRRSRSVRGRPRDRPLCPSGGRGARRREGPARAAAPPAGPRPSQRPVPAPARRGQPPFTHRLTSRHDACGGPYLG